MSELISVIVPVFNVSEYIENCILSIIKQTYKLLEIILVDDGSEDNSGLICDEYSKQDKRIKVIHQKNRGLVNARKVGLSVATGDYIGFVDGDDSIADNFFEELHKAMIEYKVECVHSGFIANGKKVIPETFQLVKNNYSSIDVISKYIFSNIETQRVTSSIWSKLFKKETIIKAYNLVPDSQSYGEDLVCLLACFLEKISFVAIEKALYFYTIRDNSLSNTHIQTHIQRETDLYETLNSLFNKYGQISDLKNKLDIYFQRQCIYYLKKNTTNPFTVQRFTMEGMENLFGSRVAIYGAGEVGQDIYSELSRNKNIHISVWVDSNYKEKTTPYYPVEPIERLREAEYDYLIIAISNRVLLADIKENLVEMGIPEYKIIARPPVLL